MPMVQVRVSERLHGRLQEEAERKGLNLSAHVRSLLKGEQIEVVDHGARLEGLERRLGRLEEMAGL